MSDTPASLPTNLLMFINNEKWTFAKTMPEWPHEYIVRERVDESLFEQMVRHIRANGCEGAFYKEKYIYFESDGMLYWTMGAPINETTIINRCKKENSFECRLKNGTLPNQSQPENEPTPPDLSHLPPEVAERVAHRRAVAIAAANAFWERDKTKDL